MRWSGVEGRTPRGFACRALEEACEAIAALKACYLVVYLQHKQAACLGFEARDVNGATLWRRLPRLRTAWLKASGHAMALKGATKVVTAQDDCESNVYFHLARLSHGMALASEDDSDFEHDMMQGIKEDKAQAGKKKRRKVEKTEEEEHRERHRKRQRHKREFSAGLLKDVLSSVKDRRVEQMSKVEAARERRNNPLINLLSASWKKSFPSLHLLSIRSRRCH